MVKPDIELCARAIAEAPRIDIAEWKQAPAAFFAHVHDIFIGLGQIYFRAYEWEEESHFNPQFVVSFQNLGWSCKDLASILGRRAFPVGVPMNINEHWF
jgi:hypothetical protein